MKRILSRFALILILVLPETLWAAERVFFENCEDSTYNEWFLERSIGTSSYKEKLTTSITRSTTDPYSGSYCMTYDPWIIGNPHTNIGYLVDFGNTSKFDLRNVHTSTYYFRWKQKWETGIKYGVDTKVKILYLGYSTWGGDFSVEFSKTSSSGFLMSIFANPGHYLSYNKWISASDSIDDNQWHNMEYYINLGTTGATGSLFFKIDGVIVHEATGVTFRNQININGGTALRLVSIPANRSGTGCTGTARTWLDDIEIWDGMPDSEPNPPQDNPPTAGITSPTSQENFTSDESAVNIAGTSSDDHGISSISWTNNRGGQGTAYNDSSDWTSWSIPNISLQEDENVITVTATDSAGQTSSDSLTVTYNYIVPDLPPGDVTDFTAQPSDGEIVLNWTNPTDSDFKGTLISYSTGNDPYPATHNDGTFVCDREAAPGSSDSFKVAGLVNGIKYNYSAFTYDEAGNYSETTHVSATPNPSGGTVQAWSATYQSEDSTWDDSGARWCARVLIEGDFITQSGNQVILGFQGRDSGDYRIRKVSIAEADPNGGEGDVVDNTWSEVTFNGNSAETWGTDVATVPSGTEKLSDPVYLSIEPGKDYYVTYLLESPSVYLFAPSDYRELYFDRIDHTEDIDWSGNGHRAYRARLHAIASIYIVDSAELPPRDITNAIMVGLNENTLGLGWTNPSRYGEYDELIPENQDFQGVMIRYNTGYDASYPANHTEGALFKDEYGNLDEFDYCIGTVIAGEIYKFSFFTHDDKGHYSHTVHLLVDTMSPPPLVNVSPTIDSFTGVPASLNNPGETITLNAFATDPNGDSLTYTINFGDGTAGKSGSEVVHTYASAGTYTADVTVDDGHGNIVGKSLQIGVNDVPPAKPTIVAIK